ncbi:MAG: PorV/PorQ family protein [Bacteroidota bacterium]
MNNKFIYYLLVFAMVCTTADWAYAGNPDRQGEAGAAQLLLNPWARSAGLHSMTTANIRGVEAMRINVAGLSRIAKTEFQFSNAIYLEGTDININAFGIAQRVGESGAFGVSLMAIDLGDIPVTTTNQPEGTGATFSPRLLNLGLSYAHTFENKVSVGITFRGVSESTADLNAFGFAIDAGVQYVTGPQDNFKFGISLRNVGTPMSFTGQGLSENLPNPEGVLPYTLAYFQRSQQFELPSMLNIGGSYDFLINPKNRLTLVANFTSNSFSQDQIGGGLEYAFNDMFMIRGGYKYEVGSQADGGERAPVETGISGGLTVEVPLKKESTNRLGIDYAYRTTDPWGGTHNFALRIML